MIRDKSFQRRNGFFTLRLILQAASTTVEIGIDPSKLIAEERESFRKFLHVVYSPECVIKYLFIISSCSSREIELITRYYLCVIIYIRRQSVCREPEIKTDYSEIISVGIFRKNCVISLVTRVLWNANSMS